MTGEIRFNDLQAQRARLGDRIDKAIARVLDHGQFIMGPEVARFEDELAVYCGARHCISCANGTDAIAMVLMANGIGPGDAVFVPAFTFIATAEAVAWLGATPVFVDVEETSFNLDPDGLDDAVDHAASLGLTPRAAIPVDLFGQPADYARLQAAAERHGLFVLADAAQSTGARYHNRKVGTLAAATATSFFPSKPLGCYGDGGAVMTDDDGLAERLRSIRVHGQGAHKYDNVRIGLNARLDTIQAAILIEKLAVFDDEIAQRNAVAARYGEALAGLVAVPRLAPGSSSVWAQYTIRVTGDGQRDRMAAHLKAAGIPTAIYYPIPLPRQTAYADYPSAPGGTPVSDRLAREVLSLPMHPDLDRDAQARVVDAVNICAHHFAAEV
jgi:dTDP-4-amino-4,6-dideoxygalactose transaminase